jgi:hypothetical protein
LSSTRDAWRSRRRRGCERHKTTERYRHEDEELTEENATARLERVTLPHIEHVAS